MKTLNQFNIQFWIPSILVGVIFALFALAPQLALWHDRGTEWNGSFAIANYDEPAYAAYVQTLADGKSFRNSPYTGVTSETDPAFQHSLFSIQFLASLPTALFARAFGLSAASAMVFLAGISSFLAAFAVFWLLYLLTDRSLFAFTGTVCALTLGSVDLESVGFIVSVFDGTDSTHMQSAFMRRSVPAISFPVFILFHCFVWKYLNDEKQRLALIAPLILSFGFLVYSYLFHWTAAGAWLFALGISIVAFRRKFFGGRGLAVSIFASLIAAIMIPYVFMIAGRDRNIDSVQLLLNTRMPELFRASELIAFVSIVLLVAARKKGLLPLNGFHFVFLLSMSILPFIVFNQQIVTGYTMQPFHYSLFAVNYTVLIALFMIGFYFAKDQLATPHADILLILVSIGFLYFGFMGTAMHIENFRSVNNLRDEFAGAAAAIGDFDKKRTGEPGTRKMVVSLDLHNLTNPNNNEFPLFNSRPVLWAPHQVAFSDMKPAESRKRIFTLIHLSNYDEEWVNKNVDINNMLRVSLFGWGRNEKHLTGTFHPISTAELERVSAEYRAFRDDFDYAFAKETELDFVVTYKLAPNDFTEIDRWYERNRVDQFGNYTLYQLRLKEKDNAKQ